MFLSIPLIFVTLPASEFGIWATLTSLVAFAGVLDGGIGNGSMNLIAAAHARGDNRGAAAIFWRSLVWLTCAGVAIALLSLLLVSWIDLPKVFGEEAASEQFSAALMVLLMGISVSVPLSLGLRTRMALGQADVAFKWQSAGHLASLVGVALMSVCKPTLVAFTAASVFLPILAACISFVELLFGSATFLRFRSLQRSEASHLLREGLPFLALQLAAVLSFSSDLLLISSLRSAAEAGEFAVVQRVFGIVALVLGLFWAPLWPVYRRSLACRDFKWVEKTITRSLIAASLVSICLTTILLFSMDRVLQLIAPGHQGAPPVMLYGFALWAVLESVGTALATFFNSASILRFQIACAAAFAATCVPGKIFVLLSGHTELLPWITSGCYVASYILPCIAHWTRIWALVKKKAY